MDYATVIGMIAIGIGGISSAMWGSIVIVRYRKINFKRIVIDFVNVKQPVFNYLLVLMFFLLIFLSFQTFFQTHIQVRNTVDTTSAIAVSIAIP